MSVENLPFRLYSERYRIRGGGGSKCWVLGLVAVGVKKPRNLYGLRG